LPSFIKKQTIAEAAFLIAFINLLSKFIGFAREMLVANYFGVTAQTDAFLVALIVPSALLGLFAAGLGTLIVPFYLEKKAVAIEEARKFVNSTFLVWGSISVLVSILILAFAPVLVKIIAYGFKGERLNLAVTLTRYLVLAGLSTVLVGFFTGIFQAEKQFFLPAFVSLISNGLIVVSLYFLHSQLGIHSWTVGQLLFAVVQFLILFSFLYFRRNLFHTLSYQQIDWKEISRFAALLFPLIFSGGLSILNQIVDKTIASVLDTGSIAALNFATRVWQIPITLLAVPIATAIFPTFSELAIEGQTKEEYESKLNRTVGITFCLIIPSTVLIFILAAPLVQLFFERGAFDAGATTLTASAVRMYILALFAHAASPILARSFYSFKNTRTPLIISAMTVTLNIILNIILSKILGAPGIALATSISMIFNFIFFNLFLKKYLNPFSSRLAKETLKIILSSIPAGIICYFSLPFFEGSSAATFSSFFQLTVRIGAVGLISVSLFVISALILKSESLQSLKTYPRLYIGRLLP